MRIKNNVFQISSVLVLMNLFPSPALADAKSELQAIKDSISRLHKESLKDIEKPLVELKKWVANYCKTDANCAEEQLLINTKTSLRTKIASHEFEIGASTSYMKHLKNAHESLILGPDASKSGTNHLKSLLGAHLNYVWSLSEVNKRELALKSAWKNLQDKLKAAAPTNPSQVSQFKKDAARAFREFGIAQSLSPVEKAKLQSQYDAKISIISTSNVSAAASVPAGSASSSSTTVASASGSSSVASAPTKPSKIPSYPAPVLHTVTLPSTSVALPAPITRPAKPSAAPGKVTLPPPPVLPGKASSSSSASSRITAAAPTVASAPVAVAAPPAITSAILPPPPTVIKPLAVTPAAAAPAAAAPATTLTAALVDDEEDDMLGTLFSSESDADLDSLKSNQLKEIFASFQVEKSGIDPNSKVTLYGKVFQECLDKSGTDNFKIVLHKNEKDALSCKNTVGFEVIDKDHTVLKCVRELRKNNKRISCEDRAHPCKRLSELENATLKLDESVESSDIKLFYADANDDFNSQKCEDIAGKKLSHKGKKALEKAKQDEVDAEQRRLVKLYQKQIRTCTGSYEALETARFANDTLLAMGKIKDSDAEINKKTFEKAEEKLKQKEKDEFFADAKKDSRDVEDVLEDLRQWADENPEDTDRVVAVMKDIALRVRAKADALPEDWAKSMKILTEALKLAGEEDKKEHVSATSKATLEKELGKMKIERLKAMAEFGFFHNPYHLAEELSDEVQLLEKKYAKSCVGRRVNTEYCKGLQNTYREIEQLPNKAWEAESQQNQLFNQNGMQNGFSGMGGFGGGYGGFGGGFGSYGGMGILNPYGSMYMNPWGGSYMNPWAGMSMYSNPASMYMMNPMMGFQLGIH
jgi:hypothetical protein